MSRIQLKIMGSLAALVIVVVGASGLFAERGLRARTTEHIRASLQREAKLVRARVRDIDFDPAHGRELQSLAREASGSTGARVTLIARDGSVLGDSEVPFDQLAGMSNHLTRPEVVAALEDGVGYGMRRSSTLKRPLLYLAVRHPPIQQGELVGVVRLAVELDAVEAAVAELRSELIYAGLVGLLAAIFLSYALSLFTLRTISELRDVVEDIAAGKLERRLRWETRDERGEIAGAINRMARQMRERIDEATREKEQLEAVLASMVEGVLVLDREGKILLANPRARELLAIWGSVENRSVPEVIRSPEIDAALREASAASSIVVRELPVRTDKERVLLMHAAAFPDTRTRTGTVAVFHDVTELRKVDQVRRDFIANASHELRTPLTAIQGFADTLVGADVAPEEMRAHLDVIVRNARRMSNLIDDLLALSRVESESAPLDLVSVDVERLIQMLIADFTPRLEEAGISVKLRADDVPACRADRGATEQILSNLLSNAVRYSNPGAEIEIALALREGELEICVADTGIGIPEHELERIFERFYRVDAARSRALGSTGLGLSIVKHLVRAMDGRIRVESKLGEGSRFYFTLPVY